MLLKKIDHWVTQLLSGDDREKENAQLLTELKSELLAEAEAVDKLGKQISITEEELRRRLPFKPGDYAIASIGGNDKIGQISEVHTISLLPSMVIVALSPHFYPEYLVDIDKLQKPTPEEIEVFEANRLMIEEDIKRSEQESDD